MLDSKDALRAQVDEALVVIGQPKTVKPAEDRSPDFASRGLGGGEQANGVNDNDANAGDNDEGNDDGDDDSDLNLGEDAAYEGGQEGQEVTCATTLAYVCHTLQAHRLHDPNFANWRRR
jgi:hypothetical protein